MKIEIGNETFALKVSRADHNAKKEIKALSLLIHDNVIQMKGYYVKSKCCYLLEEYADLGDLYGLIRKEKGDIYESLFCKYI